MLYNIIWRYPIAYCIKPNASCVLTIALWVSPIAYSLRPIAYCLLPTAHILIPSCRCFIPYISRLLPDVSYQITISSKDTFMYVFASAFYSDPSSLGRLRIIICHLFMIYTYDT